MTTNYISYLEFVTTYLYPVNKTIMRKKIVFALFALMVLSFSFSGCRSKELCPAYGDSATEKVQENLS
jgi:hypothetical protein